MGALLGGFLALFHVQTTNSFFNTSTCITAIIAAVVLFLIIGVFTGGRRARA